MRLWGSGGLVKRVSFARAFCTLHLDASLFGLTGGARWLVRAAAASHVFLNLERSS